ncbi:hypothetical protein K1719_029522 [Acacia pycnantha]|nr:hypothetical protein K1719_029522 [Acacia pycnantha]
MTTAPPPMKIPTAAPTSHCRRSKQEYQARMSSSESTATNRMDVAPPCSPNYNISISLFRVAASCPLAILLLILPLLQSNGAPALPGRVYGSVRSLDTHEGDSGLPITDIIDAAIPSPAHSTPATSADESATHLQQQQLTFLDVSRSSHADVPPSSTAINSHPMQTRSKHGISKPKTPYIGLTLEVSCPTLSNGAPRLPRRVSGSVQSLDTTEADSGLPITDIIDAAIPSPAHSTPATSADESATHLQQQQLTFLDVSLSSHADETATIARNPILVQDHVVAERKRREKLSQRIALSAILPGLIGMDKASILGDAINYVKQLEGRVKTLEEQLPKKAVETAVFVNRSVLHVDDNGSSSDENSNNLSDLSLPEIEARVSGKDVLIRIHCDKQNGCCATI